MALDEAIKTKVIESNGSTKRKTNVLKEHIVEIISAEIRPPARSVAGASGNRIRIGSKRMTNGGNETDLVVAFNEQVLLGRVHSKELRPGCTILLESMWRNNHDRQTVAS